MKRAKKFKEQLEQRRPSLKQPLPKNLLSKSCKLEIEIKYNYLPFILF